MRLFVAAAAALLAVSSTSPALATTLPTMSTSSVALQASPSTSTTAVLSTTTKKKKKKKTTTTSESVSIENIPTVRRGKTDVDIVVKLSKSDRTCTLKVKWADGSTDDFDEVEADGKKCTFTIDIPDDRSAVGTATATATVRDSKEKKVGTAKKTFTVK